MRHYHSNFALLIVGCFIILQACQEIFAFKIQNIKIANQFHTRVTPSSKSVEEGSSLQKQIGSVFLGLWVGSQTCSSEVLALTSPPVPEVKSMGRANVNELLLEEELGIEEAGSFFLPFYKSKDFEVVSVSPNQLKDATERIKALQPYLDEIERYIFAEQYKYLGGFLGVFAEQENAFVQLIDGLFPSDSPADESARSAMQYEAQRIFLALDDLRDAARDGQDRKVKSSYIALAKAYDRFLKAGSMTLFYDPVVSTEPLYDSLEVGDRIIFDQRTKPKVQDQVILVRGPDKGRTGVLLSTDSDSKSGVVKLDYIKEVREVPLEYVMKQMYVKGKK
mmetsp:Transcript_7091/g.9493  ORF Transcript_7091/g.9493 Transcript_7091/m.9493 type:complete len:335 (-) Transcript_7091:592-1596(-)